MQMTGALQHFSLALVAGLQRATDEGPLPEIAQYNPYCLTLFYSLPKVQTIIFYLTQHEVWKSIHSVYDKI